MPEELFSYGSPPWVQVTPGRVIIGARTYAMGNISSVTRDTKPASKLTEQLVGFFLMLGILVPVVLLALTIQGQETPDAASQLMYGIAGLVSFIVGGAVVRSAEKNKPTHLVFLHTNAGQEQALATADPELANGLVEAISRVLDGGAKVAAASPVAVGGGFCSACGKALASGAKFCANCGAAAISA